MTIAGQARKEAQEGSGQNDTLSIAQILDYLQRYNSSFYEVFKSAILERVSTSGQPIHVDNTSNNSLASALNELQAQEAEEAGRQYRNLQNYLENASSVDIVGLSDLPLEAKVVSINGEDHGYRIKTDRVNDIAVLSFPEPGKNEDAVRVDHSKNVLSIVLADGASSSAAGGRFAARYVVQNGIRLVKDTGVSLIEIPSILSEGINNQTEVDLPMAARGRARHFQQLGEQEEDLQLRGIYGNTAKNIRGYLSARHGKGGDLITSATAAFVRYDENMKKLEYALCGDTAIVIFKRGGSIQEIAGYGGHISYERYLDRQSFSDVVSDDLSLKEGDVVMVVSDFHKGLPSLLNKINDLLRIYRHSSQVIHAIVERIKEKGPSDDSTAVAFCV